eukprot:4815157-Amphidinium_carterae.4
MMLKLNLTSWWLNSWTYAGVWADLPGLGMRQQRFGVAQVAPTPQWQQVQKIVGVAAQVFVQQPQSIPRSCRKCVVCLLSDEHGDMERAWDHMRQNQETKIGVRADLNLSKAVDEGTALTCCIQTRFTG